MKIAQSSLTLCNSMDCSLPGSSVHGILQNIGMGSLSLLQRIVPTLESNQVSCIAGRFFTSGATREATCPWIIFVLWFFVCLFLLWSQSEQKEDTHPGTNFWNLNCFKHQSCFHSWISDHFGISKYRLAQLGTSVHVLLGYLSFIHSFCCLIFIINSYWY